MRTESAGHDSGKEVNNVSMASVLKRFSKVPGVFWALVLLVVAASSLSSSFLSEGNLINIARNMSIYGIVAIGMTFVILIEGIDLSVGSIIGIVAVVSADLLTQGVPAPVVMLLGLAIGAALGAFNGIGVSIGRIPAFIMTLGVMFAGRGFALFYSKGQPIGLGEAASSISWLGTGYFLGLPVPVWIFLAILLLAAGVLKFTPFGRHVYAVGDNREAARLSGINVTMVEICVFAISGLLAAITSLILISRLTVGEPTLGTSYELNAIAMAVIGGTSLFGGVGGVGGTLIGIAIVTIIGNALNLIGISPFLQQVVTGLLIIVALLLERFKR